MDGNSKKNCDATHDGVHVIKQMGKKRLFSEKKGWTLSSLLKEKKWKVLNSNGPLFRWNKIKTSSK